MPLTYSAFNFPPNLNLFSSDNHVNWGSQTGKYKYFECLTFLGIFTEFNSENISEFNFRNSARIQYKKHVHNQFHLFFRIEALNWQNHQAFMEYARSGATLETASFKSATRCFFWLSLVSIIIFQFSYPKQNQIFVVIVIKCNVLVVNQFYRLPVCPPHARMCVSIWCGGDVSEWCSQLHSVKNVSKQGINNSEFPLHFKFIVCLAIVKSQRSIWFEIVRQFLLAGNSSCRWAFYFLSSSVHIFINLIVMWFTRDRIEYLMGLSQSVVMLCQCMYVMNSIAPVFFHIGGKKICSTCPTHVHLQFTTFARIHTLTHHES